jgi:hypothetical protein
MYVEYPPGIETRPMTFREFIIGVAPAPTASFVSLNMLSHPVAPKDKSNSISLLPPSIICFVRSLTVNETPLMQFPNSIPHMGITYCGFHRGSGRMTTRNANAPTTMIDEKMARNVINAWYLYVYLILVIDSLVAMRVMKKTSCCCLGKLEEGEGETASYAQNTAMENVRR